MKVKDDWGVGLEVEAVEVKIFVLFVLSLRCSRRDVKCVVLYVNLAFGERFGLFIKIWLLL